MNRNIIQVLATSLMLIFAMIQTTSAQDLTWLDSPDEAAKIAARSGKLIAISVGADWCHYCKKMDRETWLDRKVKSEINQNYVPLKLADGKHRELLAALQIKAFPTTLVYTSDRKLLKKIEGYIDPKKMAFLLEQTRIGENQKSSQTPLQR